MNKNPLSIAISIIFNLNLLEENKEYNINELRVLPNLDHHWMTIKKYLKIANLIQKYCPKIEIEDSTIKIEKSPIYRRFNEKEKLALFLFNKRALSEEKAENVPENLITESTAESVGYLFEKTEDDKYYLTGSGTDVCKSINQDLSELIFEEKEIEEVFPEEEIDEISEDTEPGVPFTAPRGDILKYVELTLNQILAPQSSEMSSYQYTKKLILNTNQNV